MGVDTKMRHVYWQLIPNELMRWSLHRCKCVHDWRTEKAKPLYADLLQMLSFQKVFMLILKVLHGFWGNAFLILYKKHSVDHNIALVRSDWLGCRYKNAARILATHSKVANAAITASHVRELCTHSHKQRKICGCRGLTAFNPQDIQNSLIS